MDKSDPPMKSVQFAFEVIETIRKLDGAGPSKLAREMEIPKSTAHAYLQTLQSSKYIINDDGEYQLSHKFLSMASKMKRENDLVQAATGDLENLAKSTGELTALVIEEGGRSVMILVEEGEQAIDVGIYPGITTPLHSQAAGKVLLAHMPKSRYKKVIETYGLKCVTSKTITDDGQLQKELEQIREDGFAIDWNQQIEGMGVNAVPLTINDGVKGAIAIACPTERIKNEEYQKDLLRKLQETRESISIKYQYGN